MRKKAFSLIELLIVIVIIGVVYTLAISGIQKMSDKAASLSLVNLKEYLTDMQYEKNIELICLDDCSVCDIFVDGTKSKKLEDFLDSSVKVYRYDMLYGYVQKEKDIFFNENGVDEDICFSYKLTKDGVGTQMLVEYNEAFYDFSPYFSKTIKYDSIQEIEDIKETFLKEITQ